MRPKSEKSVKSFKPNKTALRRVTKILIGLKMEEYDEVDNIYLAHAHAIARARIESDLQRRVEAMEKANAELDASFAKMTERQESALFSNSSVNNLTIETELDEMVSSTDGDKGPAKIIKQRMKALINLGEMPCSKVPGEGELKAQIAWFIEVVTLLNELIDLGKNNSEVKTLKAIVKDFLAVFSSLPS